MKVGIVGLGHRLAYLARVFSAERADFQVVGHVDPAPAGLPYARQHGIAVGTHYPSLEAMLDAEQLDLLMVGSPNHLHLGHIRTGLERGLKVFTEKPVVVSIEETMEIAALIARYGSDNLMVGLVLRYAPLYRDLRQAQADGLLGDIASIEASSISRPIMAPSSCATGGAMNAIRAASCSKNAATTWIFTTASSAAGRRAW